MAISSVATTQQKQKTQKVEKAGPEKKKKKREEEQEEEEEDEEEEMVEAEDLIVAGSDCLLAEMEAGTPVVKTVTGEDRLIDRPRVTLRTAKVAVVPLNNR